MNVPIATPWHEANQQYLLAALAIVRAALERHAAQALDALEAEEQARAQLERLYALADDMSTSPALARLCATFGLSPFERDVLLMCAGIELDSSFVPLCAAAQGDPSRPYPTFGLALAALDEPHWSALTPDAPLRYWRLIEISAGSALTLSPLRIDERILHYLAGVQHLDERLAGIVAPLRIAGDLSFQPGQTQSGVKGQFLAPSHQALVERLIAVWSGEAGSILPVIQLCGPEVMGKRAIAAATCAALGLSVSVLSAEAIPAAPGETEALLRLWQREAALTASALFLECDELDLADTARTSAIARLIEHLDSPLIVASHERRHVRQRLVITFDVPRPGRKEQHSLWRSALGGAAGTLNGQVEALISQFNLSLPAIHAACAQTLVGSQTENSDPLSMLHAPLSTLLWDACRAQTRPRLDDLAQRIDPAATWADLVLPEPQRQLLRDIATHVRQRARVYDTWGFAARGARGLGISALFTGASGTGKTMAAEVLANELRLDLYRIDLSSVVSKYIGETEKNLRRVFDAAEEGGAILLFDEADALFGKRSEVKDSHDRYANIEVSYLLQRMEAYRGLAILTTNMKNALDTAFLRRIRFAVHFPFPDAAQRAEIWRRIFPAETPTEGLDLGRLARLNVAGGNIRNIALNAAFLAADAGEPVRMAHLLRAARGEYAKLEKPLTEAEIGGWT